MKLQPTGIIFMMLLVLSLSACIPPEVTAIPTQPTEQQLISTSSPTVTIVTEPTQIPTTTPIPPPIECKHPAVTNNVFPQLNSVNGQFPFYGEVDDPNFLCQGVSDNFHTGPLSVRLEYKNVDTNYGFWGIAMPNGYNATQFSQICFWAYVQNPNQAFRLKLRDTSDTEKGVVINVDQGGKWIQYCTQLSKFSEQGVKLDILKNVNLGFEEPTGSAIVWVDDFEFRR